MKVVYRPIKGVKETVRNPDTCKKLFMNVLAKSLRSSGDGGWAFSQKTNNVLDKHLYENIKYKNIRNKTFFFQNLTTHPTLMSIFLPHLKMKHSFNIFLT